MNEREYIALIDPFKNKLFRFAKRFLVSVEEAEDATQDVLLKLWNLREKLGSYNNRFLHIHSVNFNQTLNLIFP